MHSMLTIAWVVLFNIIMLVGSMLILFVGNKLSAVVKQKSLLTGFFILLLSLFVSACGGGGSGSPQTDPDKENPTVNNAITLNSSSSFPYNGSITVDNTLNSFSQEYKITGLTPGQAYALSLASSDSTSFSAYAFSDFTSVITACSSDTSCNLVPDADGNIYIKVNFFSTTSLTTNYTLSLSVLSNFEGSPTTPVALDANTQLPYSKIAPADLNGYYQITGLTAGNEYRVNLQLAVDASASLFVYQDLYSSLACRSVRYTSSLGNDASCFLTTANSSVWVRVEGVVEGEFTLGVTDNGQPGRVYSSQGAIGNELELTLGETLLNATVDYTASFYHIGNLIAGQQYRVYMNFIDTDNVDLYVYDDSAYSSIACSSTKPKSEFGSSKESCIASASGSGELWVKVDGSVAHQYLGATYFLTVNQYYPNEGTSGEPILLDASATNPLHRGSVDTLSYYKLSDLSANTSYIVDLTNLDSSGNASLTGFQLHLNRPGESSFFSSACNTDDVVITSVSSAQCIIHTNANGDMNIRVESEYEFTGLAFDISASISPVQPEGTDAAPIALAIGTAGLPHAGSIGGAASYYELTGLTPGEAYTMTLSNAAFGNALYTFTDLADLGDFTKSACKDIYYESGDAVCTSRAASTSMWIMVDNNSAVTYASYSLNAVLSPYQSEGSVLSPVLLPIGPNVYSGVSHAGNVSSDQSYYEFSGLSIGETYIVAITDADTNANESAGWYVYDDSTGFGSTSSPDYFYFQYISRDSYRYIAVTATDTSIWLMVDGSDTANGTAFTISLALQPVDESLIGLGLGDFPRTASTDGDTTSNSAYEITGLVAGQLYDVSLTNLTDTVYLYAGCSSITSDVLCTAKANSSGVINIQVADRSNYGAFYTLGISAGAVNEGSDVSPVLLDSSNLPYNGQVATTTSYYKVSGLQTSTLYAVSLTNLTGQATLRVYDGVLSSALCSSSNADTQDELCGATSTATGELFVQVSGSSSGAHFVLNLVQGLAREGAEGAELTLAYGTSDLPYSGSVDKTASYYKISGLSGKVEYLYVIKNQTGNANLTVFDNLDYIAFANDGYCPSTNVNDTVDACVATSANGGVVDTYIKVSGTNSFMGSEYTLDVLPIPTSEGSTSTPVLLDADSINLVPYAGQMGAPALQSNYQINGLTATSTYQMSVDLLHSFDQVKLYTSHANLIADTPIASACTYSSSATVTRKAVCSITATATSFWVQVLDTTPSSGYGTYLNITIQ